MTNNDNEAADDNPTASNDLSEMDDTSTSHISKIANLLSNSKKIKFHDENFSSDNTYEFLMSERSGKKSKSPIGYAQLDLLETFHLLRPYSNEMRGIYLMLYTHCLIAKERGVKIAELPSLLNIQKRTVLKVLEEFANEIICNDDGTRIFLRLAVKELNSIRERSANAANSALKRWNKT